MPFAFRGFELRRGEEKEATLNWWCVGRRLVVGLVWYPPFLASSDAMFLFQVSARCISRSWQRSYLVKLARELVSCIRAMGCGCSMTRAQNLLTSVKEWQEKMAGRILLLTGPLYECNKERILPGVVMGAR